MASLPLVIHKPTSPRAKKFVLELDISQLERLMDACGWYSEEFLESLDRAEEDIRTGRVYPLKSFKDLRMKPKSKTSRPSRKRV